MRKFFFVICSLAMASAIVGLSRAVIAMVEGNWQAFGDANLLWLQWANDIGIKRILITIPLALLVVHFLNKFKLIQIFQSGRAAIACLAFAALPHLVTAITTPDSSAKPTVVLITLDSVRLDHLGWGGSELPTSPKLDALAANGVRFTHNISQSSWTKPSTATLLTGLVPNRHHANSRYSPLIKSQRTLAEVMSLAGYRTRCYSSNPNITPTFGFMQGFEFMHHDVNTPAEQMVAEGEQWLNAAKGQASFLYLHLNDAHYPYAPREPYAGLFNKTNIEAHLDGPAEMDFRHSYGETFTAEEVESLRLSYAEEIKYLDDIVGDFVEKIMSEHDNLIVVITSDHGEEFLEHGDLGHGHTLFDELIRIPLQFSISEDLSKANNWEPQTHDFQVRQMDVLPTIIEMCGIEWDCDPVQLDGASLLPFFSADADTQLSHRPAVSETDSDGSPLSGMAGPLRSYRLPDKKLIIGDPWHPVAATRTWMFDLQLDPRELNNLAHSSDAQALTMFEEYYASGWLGPTLHHSSVTIQMTENEKAQLAAMGYSDDAEESDSNYDPYLDPRAIKWAEVELPIKKTN